MTTAVPLPRRLRWQRILIPAGVSLVTLIGLGFAADVKTLPSVFHGVDPVLIGLAALKTPVLILLWSLRWHLLLHARRFPIPFHHTMKAALVRSFFNNLTPGAGTGGEPFGAYYLSRKTSMTFKEAIASTAAERMAQGVVMVSIILIAMLVCMPLLPLSSTLIQVLLAGLAGFMVFVGLMFYLSLFRFGSCRRIIETVVRALVWALPFLRARWDVNQIAQHLDGFHQEYRAFLKRPQALLGIVVVTTCNWGLDFLQPYLLFQAFHVDVPFWLIVVSATTIKLMGIFSIIPGGAGLVEGMNFGLYTGLSSVPQQVVVAETILFRALDTWVLWLVSGIVTSLAASSLIGPAEARTEELLHVTVAQ